MKTCVKISGSCLLWFLEALEATLVAFFSISELLLLHFLLVLSHIIKLVKWINTQHLLWRSLVLGTEWDATWPMKSTEPLFHATHSCSQQHWRSYRRITSWSVINRCKSVQMTDGVSKPQHRIKYNSWGGSSQWVGSVFKLSRSQCVCSLWLFFSQQNAAQQRGNDICFHITVLIIVPGDVDGSATPAAPLKSWSWRYVLRDPIISYSRGQVSFRKLHNASNQITEQTRKEITYWNMNMYKLKDCTCTNLCRCAKQVGVDSSCLYDRSIWSCGDRISLLYTWSAWIKGASPVLHVYNLLWGLTQLSHPESELSSDAWVFWWCLYWLRCVDWQMGAWQPHRSHPGEWRAGVWGGKGCRALC